MRPMQGDPRVYDPYLTPDWRWSAACEHIAKGTALRRWEDPAIAEAVRFLRPWVKHGPPPDDHTRSRMPALAAAHDLFDAGGPLRDEVEARLLAGESPETIATKAGLEATTVDAFERVFFNVADRLDAHDWLVTNVVQIWKLDPDNPDEGRMWKWLAVAFGPHAVDIMIDDRLGRPEPILADRPLVAAQGRWIAREAAYSTSGRPRPRKFFDEEWRLFRGGRRPKASDLAGRVEYLWHQFEKRFCSAEAVRAAARPRRAGRGPRVGRSDNVTVEEASFSKVDAVRARADSVETAAAVAPEAPIRSDAEVDAKVGAGGSRKAA